MKAVRQERFETKEISSNPAKQVQSKIHRKGNTNEGCNLRYTRRKNGEQKHEYTIRAV